MLSLFSSLSALLSDRGAAATLAPQVGGAEAEVGRAIVPSLARVLDGLAALADAVGPESVAALVDRHDAPMADELDRHLADGPTRPGHEILDRCFGAERGLVVIGLASALGLAPSLIGRLLPLLAPVVTAEVARRWDASGADEAGLVELLRRERQEIERAGLLRGTAFDDAGLDELLRSGHAGGDHEAAADREADGRPATTRPVVAAAAGREAEEDDGAETSGTVTTLDEERSSVGSDPAPSIVEAPGSETGSGREAADVVIHLDDGAADPGVGQPPIADDPASGRAPDSGDDATAPVPSGEDAAGDEGAADQPQPGESDRDDRPPVLVRSTDGRGAALAWLGWAVGAVVLVLLLATLLSTCSTSATPSTDGGERVIAIDPARGDDGTAASSGAGSTVDAAGADPTPAAPSLFDAVAPTRPEVELGGPTPGSPASGDLGAGDPVDGVSADDVAADDVSVAAGASADGVSVAAGASADDATADGPAPGTSLNELLELAPVTFDAASADLTDEGRAVLDRVAGFLADHHGSIVEIGGHTDSDGDEAANLDLSQERADEVLRYLAGSGIERDRLIAIGHGEASPRVPNDSLANKAINRRIEFIVR